jgi:ElaB/YqjD/DUF883 family membrane-anchored ribosome-binding protein
MSSHPDAIVKTASVAAGSLVNRASHMQAVVADQLTAAAKFAAGYVRSSPWQAAGAVALAGIAAGILMARGARRSRRRHAVTGDASSPEVVGG